MDLDLPPPKSVRIRFCGRPAITTGVVNLQILFGEFNYYLVQKVERKSIELDDVQGLEPIPQNKVSDDDSGSFFVLCSQEGLPFGSFHVEEGGDYWIADGTKYRAGAMQAMKSKVLPVGNSVLQKEDPQSEEKTFHHPEGNAILDHFQSEENSRKRHKKEKSSSTLESIHPVLKELSGEESSCVETQVHKHGKRHHKKTSDDHKSDFYSHGVAGVDPVDPSAVSEEPLRKNLSDNLPQEQDKQTNLMEKTVSPSSCLAANISVAPQVEEGGAHPASPPGGDELTLNEKEKKGNKDEFQGKNELRENVTDEGKIISDKANDPSACVQKGECESSDLHPPNTPPFKPNNQELTTESFKKSMMTYTERKRLTSPSLPTPVRRNAPMPPELSIQNRHPSPPAESPMLGLSQMPTTIVEEFSLDASVGSSYAGSEYLYNE